MNRVDILLGTYNGAPFLSEQIDSILGQSYTEWKLLIRDDGSTDKTKEIVRRYRDRYPDRIIVREDGFGNLGAAMNFSKLLEYSSAPYVMFCDQDDLWLPDKIASTLKKMRELENQTSNTPLLVHTDLKVVDIHLDPIDDSYWSYQGLNPDYCTLNRLLVQNVITGCTVMINRPLVELSADIPGDAIMHDWWIGLIAAAFGRIEALPVATVQYRQHSGNDTGADAFGLATIAEKALSLFSFSFGKYTRQAHAFLERFGEKLESGQKEMLEAFVAIDRESWPRGKATLLRYHIFKQRWTRNMGLLLCR
jgi:glycosyltransferase involved in cell wall biosynthesis